MNRCVRREKNKYSIFIVVSQSSAVFCASVFARVCMRHASALYSADFHSSLVFHFHLFHYFPISEFHLNSTDYTLFLNDHSWGLWIQKPFSWLGPLGLPYITNHIHHWGLSTCKAYTYPDEHKSHKMSSEAVSFVFLFVCVCMCQKKEYFINSVHMLFQILCMLIHNVFSVCEDPSILQTVNSSFASHLG